MTRIFSITVALVAVSLLPAAPAAAQESNLAPSAEANPLAPVGWSVMPALTYSAEWDDNVLMRGTGSPAPGDVLNVVNPRAQVDYNGHRSQLSLSYDGAFLLYRDLGSLNSYDQHAWLFARRLLTPHIGIFVRDTAASVPTTELAQLIAIPFERTGSRLNTASGGVDAAFSKRTSLVAAYNFEWVDFDHTQPGAERLLGGHSHGASVQLRHAINARLALTADYALQHALVASFDQTFDIQNGSVGVEYKFTELTHAFIAGGVSRLAATEFSQARTGPAWRMGLSRHFRTADLDLLYLRSFVPSYGFGGTMQNEEASAHVRLPLARRVYTSTGVAWRRNDPIVESEPPLRSLWIEATLGYAMTPWARLEMFYGGTHQTVDRPGGVVDRNRFGFQVITAKPVRIR